MKRTWKHSLHVPGNGDVLQDGHKEDLPSHQAGRGRLPNTEIPPTAPQEGYSMKCSELSLSDIYTGNNTVSSLGPLLSTPWLWTQSIWDKGNLSKYNSTKTITVQSTYLSAVSIISK